MATAESAAAWFEVARGRTVRALEATIAHDTGRPVERDDTLRCCGLHGDEYVVERA